MKMVDIKRKCIECLARLSDRVAGFRKEGQLIKTSFCFY